MSRKQGTTGLALFLSLWSFAEGGKLLVVPQDGSHWLSMRVVVEMLGKRGHNVVVVIPEVTLLMGTSDYYTVKTYRVPYTQESLDKFYHSIGENIFVDLPFPEKMTRVFENISQFTTMFSSACRHFLYNKELIKYLEDSKFDAVLMDPVLPCGPIIAEYLSVPSVYFMRGLPCGLDFKATQCPNPLSYVPRIFTSNSDHMTFTQRVKNLLVNAAENLLCYLLYSQYESLASEFLQREVTILELFSKASIWLLRYNFVFEYSRPVMPNMVFIGGTNCEQKKPLSKVCKLFLKSENITRLFNGFFCRLDYYPVMWNYHNGTGCRDFKLPEGHLVTPPVLQNQHICFYDTCLELWTCRGCKRNMLHSVDPWLQK
uniref:glucuronosyltransferase n=1 Tax=Terrapene triunguis TaxID=2587831 RepID=A0A674IFH0_9SAUR